MSDLSLSDNEKTLKNLLPIYFIYNIYKWFLIFSNAYFVQIIFHKVDTRKTVLDLFFGNGVALAMPFPRFVSRSTGTQGVFPQGHRICQSAVPCVRLKFPAYGRKLLSPCHSVRRVSVRPCRDTHAPC